MIFSAATPIFRIEPSAPLSMGVSLGACKVHHGDATPGSSIRIQCDDCFGNKLPLARA